MITRPDSSLRPVALSVALCRWEAEAIAAAMEQQYPTLDPKWRAAIVAQISKGSGQPLNPWGKVVRCNQLHGPGCVLLGDAAHPVTSALGQVRQSILCGTSLGKPVTTVATVYHRHALGVASSV